MSPLSHKITFGTLQPDGTLTNVREIARADIGRCPYLIMVPDHYRADGTCKCDDAHERVRMIREWEYSEADFAGIALQLGTDCATPETCGVCHVCQKPRGRCEHGEAP